jgi:hypothetical protein
MNHTRKLLSFLLFAATLLAACAPQVAESPTVDVNAVMTQGVGTFVAQFFQTQTAMYTPPTPTPLNTPTPIPSSTPLSLPSPSATYAFFATSVVYPSATPTGTYYTPTVNPSTLAYGCNNLGLINDLAPAAGTIFKPDDTFTKSWQVANTGTCDWTLAYKLVFVSGDRMDGTSSRPRNVIPPSKWTQLGINLTAPSREGTYTGYWQLSDGGGHGFGALLKVSIVVKRASYP